MRNFFKKIFGSSKKESEKVVVNSPIVYNTPDESAVTAVADDGGFSVSGIDTKKVKIKVHDETVNFYGNVDSQNPAEYLRPFFNELHNKIVANHIKEINLDVTGLDFLNSRGIKEFVVLIKNGQNLNTDQQYTINIIYSSTKPWQEKSFTLLSYFNPKLVKKTKV